MDNKKPQTGRLPIIIQILIGTLMLSLIMFTIIMIGAGIESIIEGKEENAMAEQLCRENNLTFVDDYWGRGIYCAKIEEGIITRYFPEKLNDEEFYLIKR